MSDRVWKESGTARSAAADSETSIVEAAADPRFRMPTSTTHMAINLTGLGCFAATILVLRYGPDVQHEFAIVACILAFALPIAVLEMIFLRTHRRPSAGLDFTRPRDINWRRVGVKLLGLYGTFAAIVLVYVAFPLYRSDFFADFWWLVENALPVVAILAVPYFAFVDRRMCDPEDGYYHAGLCILGRWNLADRESMRQYMLGWLVKAFFLPLMFIYLGQTVTSLTDWHIGSGFGGFYNVAWAGILAIDLIVSCTGYIFTLRLFDSHIRSTDPTLGGWIPTIICYYPIWRFINTAYLDYDDGLYWGAWLSAYPTAHFVWGSTILCLMVIYAGAAAAFGIRFSNLTNRGILTNGPFRLTKHPAYVAKNISWWMISIPFISVTDWDDAVQHCLMLLGVNLIYFLRARTEERHLSRDPDYVAYALAMNQRSVFRGLTWLVPELRYRPPDHVSVELKARPAT